MPDPERQVIDSDLPVEQTISRVIRGHCNHICPIVVKFVVCQDAKSSVPIPCISPACLTVRTNRAQFQH